MRQALGRGLEALIPKTAEKSAVVESRKISIDKIRPNHLQPRKNFDAEHLSELAASIKEHGLAQPILVSYDAATGSYELIAGERRLRASQLAGFKEIEAIIKSPASDKERLALALIENLQREDLNAIDEALGYLRLMKESQINQTQLAQIIGKSKSALSNTLRLLELPENMQKALQFEKISEGHARALLMVENPMEKQKLFNIALENKLSVHALEELARKVAQGQPISDKKAPLRVKDKPADIRELETGLQQKLGTKVEIKTKKSQTAGSIKIHFYSLSDFEKIVNIIKK